MSGKAGGIRAGRAYVEALLDTTQLDKGLKSAQAKLNGFAKQVGAIGGQLVAMGTAVLAPLAAGVKMFTSYGDQLQKMSKRTGVGVESLSALQHAADLSGTSIESLERALKGMSQFLLTVKRGGKEAEETLAAIGVTAEELENQSPEQRFLKLADAVSKVKDPNERAALAMKLFGKSGMELLPMLENGSAGIEEMMQRARELGLVMSQEDADAAAEMNDAMDEMQKSLKSVFLAIGRELLPVAKDLVQWITAQVPAVRQWIAENRGLLTTLAKAAGLTLAVGSGLLALAGAAKVGAAAIGTLVGVKNLLIGGLGTLRGLLPLAFAVTGIVQFTSFLWKAVTAQEALNAAQEHGALLNNELEQIHSRRRADVLAKASQMDAESRLEFLQKQIEMEEKNLAGQKSLGMEQARQLVSGERGILPGTAEWDAEIQNLKALDRAWQSQKDHVQALRRALGDTQEEMEETSTASTENVEGVSRVLERMREELETFGLDAAQKAIRELENLNASEEELAEARRMSAELAAKEAEAKAREEQEREAERAEAEAERATQQIADVLQQLADEVADMQITDPTDRAVERQLRDLRRLGATDEQLQRAADLVRQKEGELAGPEGLGERSFTAQGGTFSSLASLAFGSGEGDALKSIEQHTADTAKHTKKMSRNSGMTFGV